MNLSLFEKKTNSRYALSPLLRGHHLPRLGLRSGSLRFERIDVSAKKLHENLAEELALSRSRPATYGVTSRELDGQPAKLFECSAGQLA